MIVEVTSRSLTRGDASSIQRVRIGAEESIDTVSPLWTTISIAGSALGAYHGWKRTGSVGWTIGWTLLGGMFPIPTTAVAFAQGFAKKA